MSDEPDITINGTPLSQGQAMTVRVACGDFYMGLNSPVALGDDEHGHRMRKAYRERLKEVLQLMTATAEVER